MWSLPEYLAANLTAEKLANSGWNGVADLSVLTPVVALDLKGVGEGLDTAEFGGRQVSAAPVKRTGGRAW